LRLAGLDEVLARELERGFHRLGSPGHEVDMRHAGGRACDQMIR
jgi:hypothetical protein